MKYFTFTQQFTPPFNSVSLYKQISKDESYSFLFESAQYHEKKGRYTFIGATAQRVFEAPANGPINFFEKIKDEIASMKSEFSEANTNFPHAPSLFGYISFEAARFIEGVKMHEAKSTIPDAILFLPSLYIVIDNTKNELTIHATSTEILKKCKTILKRILENSTEYNYRENASPFQANLTEFDSAKIPLKHSEGFKKAFIKAKEHIAAGDLMQLVISQQLKAESKKSSVELYELLKELSPSPYQYLMIFPKFSIIGSSPETLVKVKNKTVTTCPIAGTRPRGSTIAEDAMYTNELLIDEKERAEHAMLLDLGRNDLGKVCISKSVHVTRICDLEKFSTVMHLVSEVRGTLENDKDCIDAFTACFPAGTLSGAPKKRALERIIELENTPRGIYGGAVGYIDIAGSMDFAIAIRTMLHTGTTVHLQAGAGIVADSIAENEDTECRNKMKAPFCSTI